MNKMHRWQNIQLPDISMIVFENSCVRVWIDEEIYLMHCEWKRNVSSKEYRQAHQMFLSLLKKHTIKYWIVDSTKLGEISSEDEGWFFNVIIPEMVETKVVKAARLTGENLPIDDRFENFSERVKEANEAFIHQIELRNFVNFKEAADWMGNI